MRALTEAQRSLLVQLTYGTAAAVHDTYDGRPRIYTASGEYLGTCHPSTITALATRRLLSSERGERGTMYRLTHAGRLLGVSL